MNKVVKLYQLKKGDKFKTIDKYSPTESKNVYIKGRPHTDVSYGAKRQMYVMFKYAPGEPYDGGFAGYIDCDVDVIKID